MKKFLSITLVCLMLTAVFVTNVSASVDAGIPAQTVSLFEDFNDAEYTLPLTGNTPANYWVDKDKAHSARKTGVSVNLPEQYTLEFDILFEDNQYRPVNQMFIYINDADCSTVPYFGVKLMNGSYKLNTWYTLKLVVDESKMSGTNDLSGTNHVKLYQKLKGEDEYKESIQTKGSDGTVTSDETFVYRSHTAYADTTNVLGANAFGFNSYMVFDNVKVSWIEDAVEYPSTGVLYTEDFEGKSPSFIGQQAALVTDNGNSYMEFYMNTTEADLVYKEDGVTLKPNYGVSNSLVLAENLPLDYIVTADICMQADNNQPLYIECFSLDADGDTYSDSYGNITLAAEQVTAGEWYTLKVAKYAVEDYPTRAKFSASLKKHSDNSITTPTIGFKNNIGGRTNVNKMQFRVINNGVSTTHWLVDNICVTELGAATLKNATVVDGTVAVDLSMDADIATATPILALYKGGRLVAVDYEYNKANFDVDGAEVTLKAMGDYDAAYVLLWNETTPAMKVFDITENL